MPRKSNAGRPTVMTEATIAKLEHGFSMGLNVTQACLFAGISRDAFYDYANKTPGYSDRIEDLRETTSMRAIVNIATAVNEGSKDDSWKWATVRIPEFNPKSEIKATGTFKVTNTSELPDEELHRLAAAGEGGTGEERAS